MTDEARVVALDRLWPGDIADRSGELLDVVFGWADFARLRRQVAAQCADAGLTGTRLELPGSTQRKPARCVGRDGRTSEPGEPIGADCGRGLWLAATLADELSITSGPDTTIVSLYMRLE